LTTEEPEYLEVTGARVHNLRDVSVRIPRNKMVVITGISGSGKSSLAFDTIYAEGQRRYMETFGSYARQFIGEMERPDVESITGLSPVISIEQKTVGSNPRSTVGTITELYDFLRLLYARAADAYSYNTGKKMVRYTDEQMVQQIQNHFAGKKIAVLAPIVRGRKGHYREDLEAQRKSGYTKVRVDGEIKDLVQGLQLDRYVVHDIEVVIDRLQMEDDRIDRLQTALNTASRVGKGMVMIMDYDTNEVRSFSKTLMCQDTGISYEEPSPNAFSFNSPYGYCAHCKGLGIMYEVDMAAVIPDDDLSINDAGIAPFGEVRNNMTFDMLRAVAKKYNFTFSTPICDIPKEAMHTILYGGGNKAALQKAYGGNDYTYNLAAEGLVAMLKRWYAESDSDKVRDWAADFMAIVPCGECNGARLRKESLYFKIADKNISEISNYDLQTLHDWLLEAEKTGSERQQTIGKEVFKELNLRLGFLLHVGLDYLSLARPAGTLSGGESQRIRLATQIGSQLTGVTYILDEPSIGLHQRDNEKLIAALKQLSDIGNTVLVVEHDKDIMLAADYLLDLGPGAGKHGGKVVGEGTPADFLARPSTTSDYLAGRLKIDIPTHRRKGNGKTLVLEGATGNNLKNVTITIPLGTFTSVTGVSGSGKSTLINDTLYPILRQYFYKSRQKPLAYANLKGLKNVDKVIEIDQAPIGRTPRSNAATYTGVFTDIRNLFAEMPEAKIRGYKTGRFSFNVKGGRCETCEGGGMRVIEMNFLPDVSVLCETCNGRRYNRETLEIRYRGKSIGDVLEMTVEEAVVFFEKMPKIHRKISTLNDVGLGYITLGQSATTLSGGEAQRVKLAEELSKKDTGNTIYILDEPTTGLHFEDVRVLLGVLQKLVDKGNTLLVIEHNLDVVKVSDHVIDIGPEGGGKGGTVIGAGTPEQIAKLKNSHTGRFLKMELK
jgi:excinuclease ABC subunit A